MSDYQGSGAAPGRGKYLKTYGLGGIRNDSFLPVGNEYADLHWKKTGQDFRRNRGYTGAVSKRAKEAIKNNLKKNRGYKAGAVLEVLGWAAKYSGIGGLESVGDGLILTGATLIAANYITDSEDKSKTKHENGEPREIAKKYMKKEYFSTMKELMESNLQPDEKVDVRELMGVDKFTPKLFGDNGYRTSELESKLESMKSCLKGYMKAKNREVVEKGNAERKAA